MEGDSHEEKIVKDVLCIQVAKSAKIPILMFRLGIHKFPRKVTYTMLSNQTKS